MLAYRVRKQNKTGQTKKTTHTHTTNGVITYKNRKTKINVLSVFFVAARKSRSGYILVHDHPSIFQDRTNNVPHYFHVYLSLKTKRGCTSKGMCDYQGCSVSNVLWFGCKNYAGHFVPDQSDQHFDVNADDF